MSAGNLIKTENLKISDIYLYVGSWNGASGNINKNSTLQSIVIAQLGVQAAALFVDDFINYKDGYILCSNTAVDLQKFFNSGTQTNPQLGIFSSKQNSLRFTFVKMPEQFINQKGKLSSDYKYGEKLRVVAAQEILTVDLKYQFPDGAPRTSTFDSYQSSLPANSSKQIIIFRDSNIKGRSVVGKQSGGGGLGIWS